MITKIFTDNDALSDYLAEQMIELILAKPTALICFASGNSPRNTAACFVQKVQERKVDLSRFHFIGLDEWVGVPSEVKGSCQNDFRTWLFDPLGIKESQYHLFNGMAANLDEECIRMDEYISAQGGIDMMVVGPEEPLTLGIADAFAANPMLNHVPVIGPNAAGAQLEGSKDFSKAFMMRHGIPTARYKSFTPTSLEEGKDFLSLIDIRIVLGKS